jgi:hypothetical protein
MDANALLYYLRGFFENVAEPTAQQINSLRMEVLQAKAVVAEIIPVEVVSPMKRVSGTGGGGCGGCGDKA